MQPIGPLMHEHRRIERMVELVRKEGDRVQEGQKPDAHFLLEAADFFSFYADRTHHGKEEDILFQALKERDIPDELDRIRKKLEDEHEQARKLVGELRDAARDFLKESRDEASDRIADLTEKLATLYPEHIRTEDEDFFFPCMELLSEKEQKEMLDQFYEFDKELIHEKYENIVAKYEEQ